MVLLQDHGCQVWPVAVASSRLRAREPTANPLIAKLEAMRWAVRELGRYTVPALAVLVTKLTQRKVWCCMIVR